MLIKDIHNPKEFFEKVSKCKGSVELVTGEGDRLNLKSTLCQYIALTQMFEEGILKKIELVVEKEEDLNLLLPFLVTE